MATLLVNAGRAILTNRILGAGTEPNFVAHGTGAGTTTVTDTTLFTEVTADGRSTGAASQQTTSVPNDTYQVIGTLTAAGAETITNAGLFDVVTSNSGNLFVKGDFTGIGLNMGDSIQYTIKLQFT